MEKVWDNIKKWFDNIKTLIVNTWKRLKRANNKKAMLLLAIIAGFSVVLALFSAIALCRVFNFFGSFVTFSLIIFFVSCAAWCIGIRGDGSWFVKALKPGVVFGAMAMEGCLMALVFLAIAIWYYILIVPIMLLVSPMELILYFEDFDKVEY